MRFRRVLLIPIVLAAGAAVLTAAVATTGGSRDATLEPSFIGKINALCARERPLAPRLGAFPYRDFDPASPRPGELPAVGAYYAPRVAFLRSLLAQLAGQGEPARARRQWDQLRALAGRYVVTATRQVAAARAADATGFARTAATIGQLKESLALDASALGFTLASPCARAV